MSEKKSDHWLTDFMFSSTVEVEEIATHHVPSPSKDPRILISCPLPLVPKDVY